MKSPARNGKARIDNVHNLCFSPMCIELALRCAQFAGAVDFADKVL
jgi:hypothetical protein